MPGNVKVFHVSARSPDLCPAVDPAHRSRDSTIKRTLLPGVPQRGKGGGTVGTMIDGDGRPGGQSAWFDDNKGTGFEGNARVKRQRSRYDLDTKAAKPTMAVATALPTRIDSRPSFEKPFPNTQLGRNGRSPPNSPPSYRGDGVNNPIQYPVSPQSLRGPLFGARSYTAPIPHSPLRSNPTKIPYRLSERSNTINHSRKQSFNAESPIESSTTWQTAQTKAPRPRRSQSPKALSQTDPNVQPPTEESQTSVPNPPPPSWLRDRGLSVSSTKTAPTTSTIPLRPSISIPDSHSVHSVHSVGPSTPRHRNYNPPASAYRPDRGQSPQGGAFSPRKHESPLHRHAGSEEIRTSFRSGLTIASSFAETSGTERSSVLTKNSSISDFGTHSTRVSEYKDDGGFSVDDAIGLYADGFADDTDDEETSEPKDVRIAHGSASGSPKILGSLNVDPVSRVPSPLGSSSVIAAPSSPTQMPSPTEPDETSTPLTGSPSHTPPPFTDPTLIDTSSPYDCYGFYKATSYQSQADWNSWHSSYSPYLSRRRHKWESVMKSADLSASVPTTFPSMSPKIKRFIRKGIPAPWRGAAWFCYSGGPARLSRLSGAYLSLCTRVSEGEGSTVDIESIERDLHRTFPDNIHFKPAPAPQPSKSEPPIFTALRRLLRAFALHNPRVGYCQSLNFIAGMLLLFLDEEKAFILLDYITQEILPGTHTQSLEGANTDQKALMEMLKNRLPKVWAVVGGDMEGGFAPKTPRRRGRGVGGVIRPSTSAGQREEKRTPALPPITLCCTPWLMAMFIGALPVETTLRVWDVVFAEGPKMLFRVSLTIFRLGEKRLLSLAGKGGEEMEVFQVVQNLPRGEIDPRVLLGSCFERRGGWGKVRVGEEEVRRLRAE
ncbi:MAG: hypothetical protein M1824_004369 [Vezdaea acicularis]|nr:MAG: hypothetical protein M1824_004369 [Vezdaea acicularis]